MVSTKASANPEADRQGFISARSRAAGSNLTAWDPTDQDVLKITDIGFVQQTSGTISALLDFSFALEDADGDQTATQHILVNVSNDFIH